MGFTLLFTEEAERNLRELEADRGKQKRWKAVRKCLGLLESNPRHPGLQTHKFQSLVGPGGADVFEAYAENRTPAAFRVFWCYGPRKDTITVLAITPHP